MNSLPDGHIESSLTKVVVVVGELDVVEEGEAGQALSSVAQLLPVEILQMIFKRLTSFDQMMSMGLVCHSWRTAVVDECFWRQLHQEHYGGPPTETTTTTTTTGYRASHPSWRLRCLQLGRRTNQYYQLLEHYIFDLHRYHWQRFFMWATESGHCALMRTMLASGLESGFCSNVDFILSPPDTAYWANVFLLRSDPGSAGYGCYFRRNPNGYPHWEAKSPLMCAVQNQQTQAVSVLVSEYDADLELRDYGGQTALFYAVEAHSIKGVRQMVELGADVDVRNLANITPLMRAAALESIEIVSALLEAGADVHAQTSAGETALTFALMSNPRGDSEVAKLLLQRQKQPYWSFTKKRRI